MKRAITASQTVGPYLHIGMDPIAPLPSADIPGERVTIRGRVLDGNGAPVADGLVETWQANERGKYAHPEDWQDKQETAGFTGFGRTFTGKGGEFRFQTIRPGTVPWRGTDAARGSNGRQQAPHIVVTVFARGLLRHLTTRVYFGDEELNARDPVLLHIKSPERRATLVAQPEPSAAGTFTWDIVLQGPHETVFFDL